MLEHGFPHVSVLWAAYLLSGLFSAARLFFINRFNIGLRWGFEQVPTENTVILPIRDDITINWVQFPATGVTALQIG